MFNEEGRVVKGVLILICIIIVFIFVAGKMKKGFQTRAITDAKGFINLFSKGLIGQRESFPLGERVYKITDGTVFEVTYQEHIASGDNCKFTVTADIISGTLHWVITDPGEPCRSAVSKDFDHFRRLIEAS